MATETTHAEVVTDLVLSERHISELLDGIYFKDVELVLGYVRHNALEKYELEIPPSIINYILVFVFYNPYRMEEAAERLIFCGRVAGLLGNSVHKHLRIARAIIDMVNGVGHL